MATNDIRSLIDQISQGQQNVIAPRTFDQYITPQIDQFQTINPSVANLFSSILQNRNDTIGNTQRDVLGLYDAYQQATNPAFRGFIEQSVPYGQGLLADINKQQQQLTSLYGPQGSQYKLIDNYYTSMADLVANKARGNQAAIDAAARQSGASRGGIAAARARQGMVDTESLLKFQEGKNNALLQTYQTFQNLLGGLQDRASNVRSNFIINPYLQLAQRQSDIARAALDSQAALEQYRLQQAMARRQNSVDPITLGLAAVDAANPQLGQQIRTVLANALKT